MGLSSVREAATIRLNSDLNLCSSKGEDMIRGIKFGSIPVRDQAHALAFYTEKLGFTILTDQPMGDQRWIELGIPGADSAVVLFTPKEHEDHVGTFSHISFWCDNAEKTYQELLKKGVQFEGPPQKMPWGTFVKFKDPDENLFLLSSK
jgi:predicted enzyme related to lactoylglutathione lyase